MKINVLTFISCFLISTGHAAQAYQLPDTGQTKCYNTSGSVINCPSVGQPLYGQDAQYQSSQPSYRNNGNGTIVDPNTGLTWQQEGGLKGVYQNARNVCEGQLNSSALGGYKDWRIPNRRELFSILDYGRYSPAINTNYFKNTNPWWYWTSNSFLGLSGFMWTDDFRDGAVAYNNATSYIRCVRGGSLSPQFVDNGNSTITDTLTGLTWQKQGYQKTNWQDALAYCENLNQAGKNDWRLPNIRELESIVDYKRYGLAIDPVFQCLSDPNYWSSTTKVSQPSNAWTVNFFAGLVQSGIKNTPFTSPYYVRSVRGGISAPTLLPNLMPYRPSNWSDKVVISKTTGTNTDSVPLSVNDTLYLDWRLLITVLLLLPHNFTILCT